MVHTQTHTPKPVLCNQTVHTDREVTANRPNIIIKNKKRENMHIDTRRRYVVNIT